MRHGMRHPRELKVMWYAAHMIDINEYFSDFPVAKTNEKIDET